MIMRPYLFGFGLACLLLCGGALRGQDPVNLPAQKVGPNDLLAISVYDAPELSGTVRISAEGTLSLPMLRKPVKVAGMLPSAVEVAVAEALRSEDLLLRPVVTVRVVEYHSRPVSVVGAVRRPLIFQAVGDVSLLDAITRAEGLTPEAGAEIIVSRPGEPAEKAVRIPVAKLIDRADPQFNIKLQGGEEVRVPDLGKIFVTGNVRRPGAFPAADATILKSLALSEGLAPYAGKQAYIYRKNGSGDGRQEIVVELQRILKRKEQDVPLMANDILYIPDRSGRRIGLTALDRIVQFGSTAGATALIYRGAR